MDLRLWKPAIPKRTGLFLTLILFCLTAWSAEAGKAPDLRRLYTDYARLLEQYLTERRLPGGGLVSSFDYQRALADQETQHLLQEQNRRLARFDPDQLQGRKENIAFWVNAYNYFMIAHILNRGEEEELVESVKDFGYLLNPFRVFRKEIFTVGGERYSLDQIEKEILLGEQFAQKGWKDARLHFLVNCASVGCPPLRKTVYTAGNIDRYLEENTRLAFNTPRQLRINGETLYLTRLFDWYREDFVEQAGSIRAFVRAHASPAVRRAISGTERIRFIGYDWALNSPDNFPEMDGPEQSLAALDSSQEKRVEQEAQN